MTRELADMLVVVTGSAGGVGSACVTRLQRDGATVIGVDRVAESASDEHVQMDMRAPEVGEVVARVVGNRPLLGLVNNAAESTTRPTADVDVDTFDSMFAANVRAPFLLSETLLPRLAAGSGSVVNIASVHALATSMGAVPYAASKGALVAMTRAFAVDWASRGVPVRVNAIAPGAIDTPMLRDGLARTGTTLEQLGGRHPTGRVGNVGEIAGLVRFLLGSEAGFINGTCIVADGGALARLSTEVT